MSRDVACYCMFMTGNCLEPTAKFNYHMVQYDIVLYIYNMIAILVEHRPDFEYKIMMTNEANASVNKGKYVCMNMIIPLFVFLIIKLHLINGNVLHNCSSFEHHIWQIYTDLDEQYIIYLYCNLMYAITTSVNPLFMLAISPYHSKEGLNNNTIHVDHRQSMLK